MEGKELLIKADRKKDLLKEVFAAVAAEVGGSPNDLCVACAEIIVMQCDAILNKGAAMAAERGFNGKVHAIEDEDTCVSFVKGIFELKQKLGINGIELIGAMATAIISESDFMRLRAGEILTDFGNALGIEVN